MKENKIINYDSVNGIINNNNTYYLSFNIDPLQHVKKIYLKSIELPINLANLRNPYNIFYYSLTNNNIVSSYSFTMLDKTYNNIFSLINDLNAAIVLNINPKLVINESIIFSLSNTELNKIIMTTSMTSSNFNIINNGIILYYLGYNSKCVINTTTILGTKTNTYIFPNVYNLSFDLYYNMIFNNISTESKNNNLNACDYKIAINAISNCIYFANEFNTYTQCILIKDKDLTISNLNFIFTDRYNNILVSSLHWSMTLEYEFYQ